MHTALGDVLLVGLANDPQSVERIVAEAVTKAEAAAEIPLPQAHKTKAEQEPVAKPEPSRKPGCPVYIPSRLQRARLGRRAVPNDATGGRNALTRSTSGDNRGKEPNEN